MDFPLFQKNIDYIKSWRVKHGHPDYTWPDPRDPEIQTEMTEFGVVGQDLEKALIALCAWREMRGDQYPGMSAIVHVLVNRQKKGWFRSHLAEDVEGRNQFSSMVIKGDPNLVKYPEATEQPFLTLLKNLDVILTGQTVDVVDGALYYGNLRYVTSGWFISEIVNKPQEHPRTTTIGGTVFFR